MVLMNGSKNARNQASIVNRTNICGGPKKGGLAPRTGVLAANLQAYNNATNTLFGLKCIGNYTNPSQSTYRRAVRGLF
jgi:hypothetical protein